MKENDATEQAFKNGYEQAASKIFDEIEGVSGLFAQGLIEEREFFDILKELRKEYIGGKER